MLKLLLQAIGHCIWQERNSMIFAATITSEAGVIYSAGGQSHQGQTHLFSIHLSH
ncbi:hypothetical protein Bca101_093272 [Brassica carinata]